MKYSIVILAGGSSTRIGTGQKKELLPMKSENFPDATDSTVLSCATENFLLNAIDNPQHILSAIIFVCPKGESSAKISNAITLAPQISDLIKKTGSKAEFITGGKTRQQSVFNALEKINRDYSDTEFVAIHDGARPFVSRQMINECFKTAFENGSSAPIVKPVDTIKELNTENCTIKKHLERSSLGAIQTPQIFSFKEIYSAHKKAADKNLSVTDDTQIWSDFSGKKMFYCQGDIKNIKITYAQDIPMILPTNEKKENTALRIGTGYDLHALVPERKLFLGGVEIPSNLGEDGHSDGDALLHAICDALLGAAALGDIGEFFPPSDPKWKDADSKLLLKECWKRVKERGFELVNLDCVINIEKPKILPYREQIILSVARLLDVPPSSVFVKAKTGEKLGDIGQSRAVQVWANCLLQICHSQHDFNLTD